MNAQPFPIRPEEIHLEFIRSSGPGGQNVNKVATAVQLRFNIRNSKSLEPEVRERLLHLAGHRVNASGELIIEARRFRTQARNREDAIERLYELIEKALIPPRARKKSHPSTSSKLRRLRDKKRRSDIKKFRARPSDEE